MPHNGSGSGPEVPGSQSNCALALRDWRMDEGTAADLPAELQGEGVLRLYHGGYGSVLDVQCPGQEKVRIGIEFDAGALRMYFYAPSDQDSPDWSFATQDEYACSVTVTNGGAIVSSGYGPNAWLFNSSKPVVEVDHYDADDALKARRVQRG